MLCSRDLIAGVCQHAPAYMSDRISSYFRHTTYHTAENSISTYAQLAPYNMRKSLLFTKHVVRLVSEHGSFVLHRLR